MLGANSAPPIASETNSDTSTERRGANREYTLEVVADNRDGLLRDITQVVSRAGLSLSRTTGQSDLHGRAVLQLGTRVSGLHELLPLIAQASMVAGVKRVRRTLD